MWRSSRLLTNTCSAPLMSPSSFLASFLCAANPHPRHLPVLHLLHEDHIDTHNLERCSPLFLPAPHSDRSRSTPPQPCPAIIPISSCAANKLASPSVVSATNATANALCATHTYALRPSPVSATNVPSATTRTSASSAAARASLTPSTASSARA